MDVNSVRLVRGACFALALALAFGVVGAASAPQSHTPGSDRSGFDITRMDAGVGPGDDFYSFANGGWERATPIPADRSSVGTIARLEDRSQAQVRAILERASHDPESRMGTAYRTHLDQDAIDLAGMAPIEPWLLRLRGIRSARAYFSALTEAGRRDVAMPLQLAAEPDDGDPDRYALIVSQAGLGMPDRDYYLSNAEAMRQCREAYLVYLTRMLRLGGAADAAASALRLLAFEVRLAAASWPAAESRDARRTYNPMRLADFDRDRSSYHLAKLARGLGFRTDRVVVSQPSAVVSILKLMEAEPVETLRDMLIVRVLHRYAGVLPADVRKADFDFYGRVIDGLDEPAPRWRQSVEFALAVVPDDVSRIYVAQHFSPQTRAAAKAMVDNLILAFRRRIDGLDWMTPATKARARRKLAAFHPQIGYPDRWHDYTGLTMREGDALGNAIRAAEFHLNWEAAKVGRPIYRWEWSATPMTVDAFANYPKISIVFPAAILQPPFFDAAVDPAVNYGGIGASIAHEMTHHFDDQGARYDEHGRLASWWTASDTAAFNARTDKLAAQFDAYEPIPGSRVNGRLTLGENIADLGGLVIAYDAYRASLGDREAPTIDGLTGDQRFFLGWAQIWRLKYREADLRKRLLSNPHAPAPQRVWTVRNIDGWYRAFAVGPSAHLYLPTQDRVRIW